MPFKKNVFLLGAGASADAGAPLMWNFLKRASELMRDPRSGLEPAERERFESVFKYQFHLRKAQAFVSVDLDNIEDMFGVLDLEERVGRRGAERARENLVYLIVRTLELTIRPEPGAEHPFTQNYDQNRTAWERFAEFVARVPLHEKDKRASLASEPDSIITFNYDTLVDAAMIRVGVRPEYALAKAQERRKPFPSSASVKLLKLHGSAGWSHCPRCSDDSVFVFDDFTSSKTKPCDAEHAPMSPLIVPPTWDKGAGRSHLASVWRAAWEELRTAQRLFIVGYSAPPSDRYFRYFLASALANNYELHEVVVVTDEAGRSRAAETYKALFAGAATDHRLSFPETYGFSDYVSRHMWNQIGREG